MKDYLNIDNNGDIGLGQYEPDEYSISTSLLQRGEMRRRAVFPLYLIIPSFVVLLLLALLVAALIIY